jgi:ABC-type transporter Mla maintaining outer membrane lipid asymmetry ATPase subunit MlaF
MWPHSTSKIGLARVCHSEVLPVHPKSAETPVLQMRNISKSFGAVRVLTNVHLELRKGEIHALMGENRGGKSTLMKNRLRSHSQL